MNRQQAGVTIVELMIAITVLILVMFALFSLYDNYNTVFGSQQALFRIAGSASASMTELQQTIMQADLIPGSHLFSSGAYNTSASTLILELPAMDATTHDPLGTWDYVVFYVDNGKLYKLTEASGSSSRASTLKQLSDTVSSLTFAYDSTDPSSASKVDINLVTSARSIHQTQTYQLQQQVYLRNY
jgi:hypothetical protein